MEPLLHEMAYYVALTIEAIAILVIAMGTFQAVAGIVRAVFSPRADNVDRLRAVWLEYSHWLVAGLTLQLAADVVNTSFSTTWDEVGRLAAVAAIRTFLSYFLDREVDSTRRLQRAATLAEGADAGRLRGG